MNIFSFSWQLGPLVLPAPTCAVEKQRAHGHTRRRERNCGVARGQEASVQCRLLPGLFVWLQLAGCGFNDGLLGWVSQVGGLQMLCLPYLVWLLWTPHPKEKEASRRQQCPFHHN